MLRCTLFALLLVISWTGCTEGTLDQPPPREGGSGGTSEAGAGGTQAGTGGRTMAGAAGQAQGGNDAGVAGAGGSLGGASGSASPADAGVAGQDGKPVVTGAGPTAGPLANESLPPPPPCTREIAAQPGTLQKAIDQAMPGECVTLASGRYGEAIVTVRDGAADKPIVIKGPKSAVIVAASASRMVQIKHSHVVLHGFSLGERPQCDCDCGDLPDTLLYIQSLQPGRGVTGVRALGMTIQGSKGECVRLKYLAKGNEIGWNTIAYCGREDFGTDATICGFKGTSCAQDPTAAECKAKSVSKNGEGIYVGTAPEQAYCPPATGECKELKNPTKEPDVTRDNRIHHNVIDTRGNECVDVKEDATANLIEYNRCTGQGDPNSAGLDARGDGNVIRYNESSGNVGAGVRLGGDRDKAGKPLWGFGNEIYANVISNNRSGGIKVEAAPQKVVCGNVMSNNGGGALVGSQAAAIKEDPGAACR